ncbi:protein ABHD8-like [Amphiura filiformis]|uniref:protein ABHD8-like n=1 Tax=Amphiura filiformis TaxID=82378 RepID=UPI003B20E216
MKICAILTMHIMCGSCLTKHSHVAPSDVGQGPKIIEVRKGRWIRIQHFIPQTWRVHVAEVQDNEGIFFVNTDKSSQIDHDNTNTNSNRNSTATSRSSAWVSTDPQSSTSSLRTTSSKTSTVKTRLSTSTAGSQTLVHRRHVSRSSLHSAYDDGNVMVFLIHGVGGSSDLWRHQIDYLVKEGFEVIAPDLLGHGFSRAPRQSSAYAFNELADDMLALFDGYAKRRNILIGHSYGSSFCTKISKERSRKVTKMILISGGGPVPLEPQTCQVFGLPACVLWCIKPAITDIFERRAIHSQGVKARLKKLRAFDVPSYVLQGMMKGQTWKEGDEDYHLAITVSVLLIYGMQDKFVSLEEEEWMQETIYACELTTLESAGHMVMIECPDQVNALIHEFIQKDMMISKYRPTTRPSSAKIQLPSQVTVEEC